MQQIEFQDVSYLDADKEILKGISFSVEQGDYISIVGPSGSGKSTLLKLVCHLVSPTSGSAFFRGTNMMQCSPTELRKKIAYCFQTPVLFGDTVEENMVFPYAIRGKSFDRAHAASLLERFGLEGEVLTHRTETLSGGEKQRISLARTLLFQPEVLLLDEATSALDVQNKQIVEGEIHRLNEAEGVTILWVTHDPAQSRKNAGRLLTMESGRMVSLEVLS